MRRLNHAERSVYTSPRALGIAIHKKVFSVNSNGTEAPSASHCDIDARDVFEEMTVTSASRLVQAIQRAPEQIRAKAPQWLAASAAVYQNAPQTNLTDALYDGCGDFQALGDAPEESFEVLRHADGADSFYKYNVEPNWKITQAIALGYADPKPQDYELAGSPVYEAWAEMVGQAGKGLEDTLLPDSLINGAGGSYGWWTPSDEVDIPSSPNRIDGNRDFFTIAQIVSLAPDWYPYGCLNFTWRVDAKAKLKRPEPFDGNNPLWVQRPADQPARTGGQVDEVLVGDEIMVKQSDDIQVHLLTKEISAAILKAPGVNTYAENLALLWCDVGNEQQREVASWQQTIVSQCRSARQGADRDFDRQLNGKDNVQPANGDDA